MRKYPVEDYLVAETVSVRAALERIEKTERRTVYVVDSERHLLGSVTDGDVRRWLLDGGDMTADLSKVINPHPLAVSPGYDPQILRDGLVERGATCAPVVDEQHRVVDMVYWEEVFLEAANAPVLRQIDVPVVIMAGFIHLRHTRSPVPGGRGRRWRAPRP